MISSLIYQNILKKSVSRKIRNKVVSFLQYVVIHYSPVLTVTIQPKYQ